MATSDLTVGIDQRLSAYRSGGISRYTTELADALVNVDGICVRRILHRSNRSSRPGDLRLYTPPHHRLEAPAIGIELAARRHSFDLYHATDFVAPRLIHCPVIVTVHDLSFVRWPDQLSRDGLRYYRQVQSQSRRTAHWITPSEWTRLEVLELLDIPESDVSVVPHGIPGFISNGQIKSREERNDYIVAVGTVEPRKRYDLLLDAVRNMSTRLELIVVGAAGWNTSEIQSRLRSTERVTWLEGASDHRVNALLSNALMLALPSLAEGFGLSAIEAMARGTPVVSSGLGALSEVTGSAAEVPQRDDPESWRDSFETLAHDTARWNERSIAGHERATQFTWDRSAQQTAKIYRAIAG